MTFVLVSQTLALNAHLEEFINNSAEIVLVGNFNLPDVNCTTNSALRDTDLSCKLMGILLDHLMSQQVLETTGGKNFLDLITTTNKGLIKNLQVGEEEGMQSSALGIPKKLSIKNAKEGHSKLF